MAKKQQPELFSANLFTASSSGGAEPFGFGDSSGTLPSASILFSAPSGASTVDPFASLSDAPMNNGSTFISQTAADSSGVFLPPAVVVAPVDGKGSLGGGAGVSSVPPSQRDVAAPAEIMPTTLPQQQVTYGGSVTQSDNADFSGSTAGIMAPPQYNASFTGGASTVGIPSNAGVTWSGSAPGGMSAQVPGPPMFSMGSQHTAPQAALTGPAFSVPAPSFTQPGAQIDLSGVSGPVMGISAPQANLTGPMTTSGAYSMQRHNQSSVMEPMEVSSLSTASTTASLVGFNDGGFPAQPLTQTSGAPGQQFAALAGPGLVGPPPGPGLVGPPQVSTHVQPSSAVAGGYPSFHQPAQMRAFPIEEELREQQRVVESQVLALQYHWFYCQQNKWIPFSAGDSAGLEEAHASSLTSPMGLSSFVPTDGGRYDVELETRKRHSVYWNEDGCDVRRSSWFYKPDPTSDFVPYREDEADMLEKQYQQVCVGNMWPARFDFKGSTIHLHNAAAIVHLPPLPALPGPVRRGLDPAQLIDQGEPAEIDHLVFVVHGAGPVADLSFRSIFRAVDDWRHMTQEMMQQHFPHRRNHRVEFLPVAWHEALHGDTTGVNRKLRDITLGSCGRLRDFVNEFLLDVLFYMSPAYSQTILSTVAGEMERMHNLFLSRNPAFRGDVSVMGHSLGSCILFDLLGHQGQPAAAAAAAPGPSGQGIDDMDREDCGDAEMTEEVAVVSIAPPEPITVASALSMFGLDEFVEKFETEKIDLESFQLMGSDDFKELGVPMGPRKKLITYLREHNDSQEAYKRQIAEAESRKKAAIAAREERDLHREQAKEAEASSAARDAAQGIHRIAFQHTVAGIGQPVIRYPQLSFNVKSLYCLGSPIAMFVTVRGGSLGPDFQLPTCTNILNIFHPFDPVAYRIEPLINLAANSIPPSLVPHHKGRKRLHLELRENLGRVGANLKKSFLESMRYTWQAVQQFTASHSMPAWQEQVAKEQLEQQEKVHAELEAASNGQSAEDMAPVELPPSVDLGRLNGGERIDYVLQEHPFESFNEYLFAMQSHLCYWTSEDSSLLVLRHMYAGDRQKTFSSYSSTSDTQTSLSLS